MNINIAPDFRDLWPEHTPEELEQLTASCLADPDHEWMPPVALWVDAPKPNTILDGHHQYVIRSRRRLKIKYAKLKFATRQEAMVHAIGAQLGRRNLSPSQIAIGIVELAKNIGKSGIDSIPNLESTAKEMGVGKQTVYNAKRVSEHGAKPIVEGVKSGKFSASDGAGIANLPKQTQAKVASIAEKKRTTLKQAAKEVKTEEAEIDPNSLEAVQADLKECAKRIRAASQFFRKVLAVEDKVITRPYCGHYSQMLLGELNAIARTIDNELPVGGTPKKAKLFYEQKAEELAG